MIAGNREASRMPGSTGANGGVPTVRRAGIPLFPPMDTREWLYCVHKPEE
jgi:hypothetical protein